MDVSTCLPLFANQKIFLGSTEPYNRVLSTSSLGDVASSPKRLGSRFRISLIFFHISPRRSSGQASSFSWPGYIEIAQSSREGGTLDFSLQARPLSSAGLFTSATLSAIQRYLNTMSPRQEPFNLLPHADPDTPRRHPERSRSVSVLDFWLVPRSSAAT